MLLITWLPGYLQYYMAAYFMDTCKVNKLNGHNIDLRWNNNILSLCEKRDEMKGFWDMISFAFGNSEL